MQEVSGKDALGEWTGYNDRRVAVQGAVAMEVWGKRLERSEGISTKVRTRQTSWRNGCFRKSVRVYSGSSRS